MSQSNKVLSKREARQNKRRASLFVGYIQQNILIRFGEAVKRQRQKLDLTQQEVADLANLSRSYISEIENGKENISLENAEKIAVALQCQLTYLLRDEK